MSHSGPALYAARRAKWLTPKQSYSTPTPDPSSSRRRLEQVLSTPDALTNDEIWSAHLDKIWKGLSSGGRLKRRLPMHIVVKIVHCSWLRDGTWPAGAVVPEDEGEPPLGHQNE